MLKVLFYFRRHNPFFWSVGGIGESPVIRTMTMSIFLGSLWFPLFFPDSLARSGKQRRGKGMEKFLHFFEIIVFLCVGVPCLPRIWDGPGTSAQICDPSKVCCTMANPWMLCTLKGCPCYPASWQHWGMERRDSHTVWGCPEVLWNLIGNTVSIHRLFDLVILQLLWVVLQQQWGTRWNPAACALPKQNRKGWFCFTVSKLNWNQLQWKSEAQSNWPKLIGN